MVIIIISQHELIGLDVSALGTKKFHEIFIIKNNLQFESNHFIVNRFYENIRCDNCLLHYLVQL